MNFTSLLFALFVAGIFGGIAWLVNWGAKKHRHWSRKKRVMVRRLMLGLAVILGIFTYVTDADQRATTLFEVVGTWEETGERVWTFGVERPGIEHSLSVYPHVIGLDSAAQPVVLTTRLEVEGEPPLVEDTSEYQRVSKSGKYAASKTWESKTFRFTPRHQGTHQLIVSASDLPPPRLHLRVVDPEKRDGKRAPGY